MVGGLVCKCTCTCMHGRMNTLQINISGVASPSHGGEAVGSASGCKLQVVMWIVAGKMRSQPTKHHCQGADEATVSAPRTLIQD